MAFGKTLRGAPITGGRYTQALIPVPGRPGVYWTDGSRTKMINYSPGSKVSTPAAPAPAITRQQVKPTQAAITAAVSRKFGKAY